MTDNPVYKRTVVLIGHKSQAALLSKKVVVFGLGGVGSYATEALARAGIGDLILVDNETVEKSNINRQLYALHSTVGKYKTEVARDRIFDINPDISVTIHTVFAKRDNLSDLIPADTDYVLDAIDTVSSKSDIIKYAKKNGINILSCMGTGNRTTNTGFVICDIKKTDTCPLARKMRKALISEGIENVDVLFSSDKPDVIKGSSISSISYVPSTAGLMMAGYVINKMIEGKGSI